MFCTVVHFYMFLKACTQQHRIQISLIDFFFYIENNYLSWLTLEVLKHYKILRAPLNYRWKIWSKALLVRFYLLSRYILIRLATPFKPWYNNAIFIVGNITPYAFLSYIRSNHQKKHNHTTHLHKCTYLKPSAFTWHFPYSPHLSIVHGDWKVQLLEGSLLEIQVNPLYFRLACWHTSVSHIVHSVTCIFRI